MKKFLLKVMKQSAKWLPRGVDFNWICYLCQKNNTVDHILHCT